MIEFLKKSVCVLLIFVFPVVTSGCSLLSPSSTNFMATSSENDAEIYINGNMVGKGSGNLMVPNNQQVTVMAKKVGYFPATQTVPTRMSTTGILDIIGGCIFLIPFLGLLSPGSNRLDTNQANLVLTPQK